MTTDFVRALRERLRGDVYADDVARGIYATDASNYQLSPLAVAVPRDRDDARAAVALAAEHGVPILPRGGGTSLAGQTVGDALVLDFSKHVNRLLELDAESRWVRVEPGLVRDELNALLAPHGLCFAPDPATSSRANVGGMIGNNSSGTKSILYGKTIDHVLGLDVLLADGTELALAELSPEDWRARASGSGREAEPVSRSAETGIVTRSAMAATTSSMRARPILSPSGRPWAKAMPELVVAIAWKPDFSMSTALPGSQALGSSRRSGPACSDRNPLPLARCSWLSIVVILLSTRSGCRRRRDQDGGVPSVRLYLAACSGRPQVSYRAIRLFKTSTASRDSFPLADSTAE